MDSFLSILIFLILSLDILVMLTPHSGHTDPPKDLGQGDNLITIFQFFLRLSPLSSILWEVYTSRSKIASVIIASPMIPYQLHTGS